ncbi:MAG: YgaP-like transmembrane domain [Paracoccaceae bacterium]
MVWAEAAVGVIMRVTAATGFGPLDRRMGIKTCRI